METIKELISANPHYGYLIVATLMGFYLLGLILNWNWVLEPGGGYFNITYWIETFGRKNVRIAWSLLMMLGIICCLGLFFYSHSNK